MRKSFPGVTIKEAVSFNERLLGLMFKKNVSYAVLFKNCRVVHTFFMRFNLDIFFLDKSGDVIKEVKNVKPWRITYCKKASSVIEMPSGLYKEGV